MAKEQKVTLRIEMEGDKVVGAKIQSLDGKLRDLGGRFTKTTASADKLDSHLKKIGATVRNSEKDFLQQIRALQNVRQNLDVTSIEYANLGKQITVLQSKMAQAKTGTGAASASVLELGRVVQDSNYGIRGMANNITQLVSNMGYATIAAGGLGKALKEMWKAMMGPLGIVLAVSTAVALLERWESATKAVQKELNNLSSSSITESVVKLDFLKKAIDDTSVSLEDKNSLLEKANLEYPNLNLQLDEFGKLTKISQEALDLEIKALERNARAKAILSLVTEKLKKQEETRVSSAISNLTILQRSWYEFMNVVDPVGSTVSSITEGAKNRNQAIDDFQKEIDKLISKLKESSDAGGLVGEGLFSGVAKGSSSRGSDKKDKAVFLGYLDKDFQKRLEAYKERYMQYLQDKREAEYQLDVSIIKSDQENTINSIPRLDAEKEILDLKLVNDLARIDAMILKRKEEGDAFQDLEDRKHKILLDSQTAQAKIDKDIAENKVQVLNYVSSAMGAFSNLVGKRTEEGKAFAIAQATIDTYVGASMTLKDETIPNTFARIAAMATVIGTGLANVKSIASTKVQGRSSSTGSNGQGGREFDFNLVGSTREDQLAQAVGGQFQDQTVRAYVVGSDITNRQQLDNKIKTTATFGSD